MSARLLQPPCSRACATGRCRRDKREDPCCSAAPSSRPQHSSRRLSLLCPSTLPALRSQIQLAGSPICTMLVSPAAARKSEWRKHRHRRPAIPPPRRCRRPVGTADEHAAVRSPWAPDLTHRASQPPVVLSRSSSPSDHAAAKTGQRSPLTQQQSTRDQPPPPTSESESLHKTLTYDAQGVGAEDVDSGIPAQAAIPGSATSSANHRSGHDGESSTAAAQKAGCCDVGDETRCNSVCSDCDAAAAAREAANMFIAPRAIVGAGETSTHPRGNRQSDSAGENPPVAQLPTAPASVYVDVQGDLVADVSARGVTATSFLLTDIAVGFSE